MTAFLPPSPLPLSLSPSPRPLRRPKTVALAPSPARARSRRPENAPGPVFVDSSCIDCDTCRWLAPETFLRSNSASAVGAQPAPSSAAAIAAQAAAVACPTGSIRGVAAVIPPLRKPLFPLAMPHAPTVSYLGYTDAASFAASAWLVISPGATVMVDVPRWNSGLAAEVAALLGDRPLDYILLTHRDDVAAHAAWAERFGAPRVFHRDEVRAEQGTDACEMLLDLGEGERMALAPGLDVIATPGHTDGSLCLLDAESGSLFTGDTLAYSAGVGGLSGFPMYNSGSWRQQVDTIERLAGEEFLNIFPGHGRMFSFESAGERKEVISEAVRRWRDEF